MTLIVSIITKNNIHLIGDKTQSIEGKNGQQVTTKMKVDNGPTITITANNIRVNAENFSKLYKISDNCIIGGAGSLDKLTNYINYIKDKDSNIFDETRQYYSKNLLNAPDQILMTCRENGILFTAVFVLANGGDELDSFYYQQYTTKEEKMGVCAIGSGSGIFLNIYARIKDDMIKEYKQSIKADNYEKWEKLFIEKISNIFKDIAKYDAAVGDKIDIITIK